MHVIVFWYCCTGIWYDNQLFIISDAFLNLHMTQFELFANNLLWLDYESAQTNINLAFFSCQQKNPQPQSEIIVNKFMIDYNYAKST